MSSYTIRFVHNNVKQQDIFSPYTSNEVYLVSKLCPGRSPKLRGGVWIFRVPKFGGGGGGSGSIVRLGAGVNYVITGSAILTRIA